MSNLIINPEIVDKIGKMIGSSLLTLKGKNRFEI